MLTRWPSFQASAMNPSVPGGISAWMVVRPDGSGWLVRWVQALLLALPAMAVADGQQPLPSSRQQVAGRGEVSLRRR